MMLLGCFYWLIAVVAVFAIYKLIDRLLRSLTIGRYSEKHVLVTGCDTGFGQAAARRLDQLGCHVFAGCLTETGQQQLRSQCSNRVEPFQLDVTNHQHVLQAFDLVQSKLPPGKGSTL